MMSTGYRQWKCQYCNWVWKSMLNTLGKACPICGSTQVKATMARPGQVSPRRTHDRALNEGMELLLEAQA